MSANKKNSKLNKETEIKGEVVLKNFGKSSKSEHKAICLHTPTVDYVLRRVGGNPFNDPELHKLIGKQVIVSGLISEYTFFAKDINEAEE